LRTSSPFASQAKCLLGEVRLAEHLLLQALDVVAAVEVVHALAQLADAQAGVHGLVVLVDGRQHQPHGRVVLDVPLELRDVRHQVLQLGEVLRGRQEEQD
jgi:hypothetical protein